MIGNKNNEKSNENNKKGESTKKFTYHIYIPYIASYTYINKIFKNVFSTKARLTIIFLSNNNHLLLYLLTGNLSYPVSIVVVYTVKYILNIFFLILSLRRRHLFH